MKKQISLVLVSLLLVSSLSSCINSSVVETKPVPTWFTNTWTKTESKDILTTMADSYKWRAYDATRLTDINDLSMALQSYFTDKWYYPLNQYALVAEEYLTSLPVDPENWKLYQYNLDMRNLTENNGQINKSSVSQYIVSSNKQLFDKSNEENYDSERFKKEWENYKPPVDNLKYYNWYYIIWDWNASLLTDNGKEPLYSENSPSSKKVIDISLPEKCDKQLETYKGDISEFSNLLMDDSSENRVKTYGKDIPWSACIINIVWN